MDFVILIIVLGKFRFENVSEKHIAEGKVLENRQSYKTTDW